MLVACGKTEVANKSYPAGVQKEMSKIKGWGKSSSEEGRMIYDDKKGNKSGEL